MSAKFCRRRDVQILCTAVFCTLLSIVVSQHFSISTAILAIGNKIIQLALRLPGLILFFAWSFVISSCLLALLLWLLLNHSQSRFQRYKSRRSQQKSHSGLAFPYTSGNYWNQDLTERPQPFVYPESERIEQQINAIITIILQKNVQSWYKHISSRSLFSSVIEHLLRTALIALKQRLELVDTISIIVRKAVPIITHHLHEITIAEQHVMSTLGTAGIDALEQSSISEAVAANRKDRVLHLAARISEHNGTDTAKQEDNLQTYLREIVARLLKVLLPKQELASPLVTVFIREIIACAILQPLFNMLADPDFWNETLVVRATQAVQERARIKRFRHVLKEQTQASSSSTRTSRKKPMKNLEKLMVSTDPKDWERLYRKINKCSSLVDVKRMRDEMMILSNEMLATNYTSAREALADRSQRDRRSASKEHFIIKAMSLLEARIGSLGAHQEYDASTATINLSFDRTLALGTDYFSRFLEHHGRALLLEFWQHVARMKLSAIETMPPSQLHILDSSRHFSQDDIREIVSKYLDDPLLTVTEDERQLLKNYLDHEPDTFDVDSNEIIISVARRAYKTMETDDFPIFRTDKLYFQMVTGVRKELPTILPLTRSHSSASIARSMRPQMIDNRYRSSLDLTDLERDYFHNETMGLLDTSEKDVLEAMEDALHSSLLDAGEIEPFISSATSLQDTIDSEIEDHIFSEDDNGPNGSHVFRLDAPSKTDAAIDDLKTAAPGDLNLLEEISLLDSEIDKRKNSLLYIDKFLGSKREIDHLDRKVVLKSRAQTSRELMTLQAQKQQYEADDHALYGRSSVFIEHSTTSQDAMGNDYVLYVIEVRRVARDGTQAGWIITRRYSEFNDLFTQLKHQFPRVANFDFPKKQLNRLKSVADVRRPVLQSFLQNLLQDEEICKSSVLRCFLSQNYKTIQKRHHKTVFESLIGLTDPREAFSRLFALLESPDEPRADNPDLREVHPPPVDSHDEVLSSFAKPIVDLVLEAFDLRERSKWIKKKAVVLVLQQILGGTIESRVRDAVSGAFEEQSFVATLEALKTRLEQMSHENAAKTTTIKTKAERLRLMDLAKQTLRAYNPSYVPESAAKKIFRALQIRTLNMHLLGNITDSLVEAILVV